MGFDGKVAKGSHWVLINGERAARRSDLTSHAGLIGEGEPTVTIGSLAAARKFDRFKCPDKNPKPHVGGAIADGSSNVIIGGEQAARMGDATRCLGPDLDVSDLDATPGAGGATNAAAETACQELWQKYQDEAMALIQPAEPLDHRRRNHIINGAYADMYRRNPKFTWMGLGAYASKQVGCAMDHSMQVMRDGPTMPQRAVAGYTLEKLGSGNRDLFLDVYPQHRFYEEHGFQRFKECAGEKVPPVGGAMLDAFEALERYEQTGDEKYLDQHLESIAYHEQVFILQRDIYNDWHMRKILDANEGNVEGLASDDPTGFVPGVPKGVVELGGGKPADVVMTSECTDTTAGNKKTIPFNPGDPKRQLHDMDDRMQWIMKDIGGYYGGHQGSQDHLDDMDRLRQRGSDAGGNYP